MNSTGISTATHDVPRDAGSSISPSAVSWGAIFAGAAAAAALSLILLILGTGLGLSSASPWANDGISAKAFGMSTILWITFTQILGSGLGGYLAGRLRMRWLQVHEDEVYFRDTAHGLLAWSVASLVTAGLLGSAIGSIVHGGVQAGAAVSGGAATTAVALAAGGAEEVAKSGGHGDLIGYFVDGLFRRDSSVAVTTDPIETSGSKQKTTALPSTDPSVAEATRISMINLYSGTLAPQDLSYLGQMVAERTGLSQRDGEKRVTGAYVAAQENLRSAEAATKDIEEKARKASAAAALWLFISLLVGAFIASLAAIFGGRQRDKHH